MRARMLNISAGLICLLVLMMSAGCGRESGEVQHAPGPGQPASGSRAGGAVRVNEIELGRTLGVDKRVAEKASEFKPSDTIYASVITEGNAAETTLRAVWKYQDGQVVDESTQTIAPSGTNTTEFHISKPDGWPEGDYKVEVFLNNVPAGEQEFEVKK